MDTKFKQIKLPKKFDFLRPYQKDEVKFGEYHDWIMLNISETGMGKTVFSICSIELLNLFPVLIIVPATVKVNWKEKYDQFFPGRKIHIMSGWDSIKEYDPDFADIFIMNFDLLPPFVMEKTLKYVQGGMEKKRKHRTIKEDLKSFTKTPFELAIMDEVQKIANEKSKTYHAVKYLTKPIPYKIGLSATPIENATKDFFNILNILRPDLFPNRWKFLNRYCDPQKGWGGHLEFKGASNTEELYNILVNNVMIGHRKREVLDDLPEKVREIIKIELKNPQHYEDLDNQIQELIDKGAKGLSLQKFEMLKQIVYDEKKDNCFLFIEDLLKKVDKILIFCNHTKVITDIEEKWGDAVVKINGDVPVLDRQKIIKRFNTVKKVKICACNIKAAGTGTDGLQDNCSTAVVLELPWTPAAVDQLEGRLERFGQKYMQMIYYLLGNNTVEIDILKLLDRKLKILHKSLRGKEVSNDDLLMELIKRRKKK